MADRGGAAFVGEIARSPPSSGLRSAVSGPTRVAGSSACTSVSSTRSCGRFGPASDGLHVGQIQFQRGGERRRAACSSSCHRPCALAYASTSAICSSLAAGQAQVAQRLGVDREDAAGRAVLGRHVADRRAVGQRQVLQAVAEELDELADHAVLAQHLGHGQHQIGRGRAFRQLAGELEADDLRNQHRRRLAEHRGFRLDAADAPAEHAEAVDHRRVRIGAEHGVRIRPQLRRPVSHVITTRARYSRLT